MEAILIKGGGGGVTSDDVTAKANDVLKGTSTLTSDSNDDVTEGTLELTGDAQAGDVLAGSTFYNTDAHTKQTGTIPRNGEISGSLNCGESKKIPAGYTTGGTIIAIDLASQTGGATAADGNVLTGKTYWKDGVKRTGTMPERGAVSQELAAGGSYTVPEGHHDGAGRVIAKSLASQTGGATATDSTVLDGKTYWKDGAKRTGNIKSLGGSTITPSASAQTVSCSGKYMTGNVTVNAISGLNAAYILKGKVIGGVTGTLAVQSAISFSAAALSYNKIRISWKNPAKGPWQGVFIQMSTSGNPGTGGGSRAYTGSGNNPSQANGSNYVDIGGLNPATTYYFTCTSYCDALGWGSSYNISVRTAEKTPNDIFAPYDSFALVIHTGNVDHDPTNIVMSMASKASTPYTILTGTSTSYVNKYVSLKYIQFIIVYQYGINVAHNPISQKDLDIFKGYKVKAVRESGLSTIHDFGKITDATLYDFSGSALNYHYYGIKFTVTTAHRLESSRWTKAYIQFYK